MKGERMYVFLCGCFYESFKIKGNLRVCPQHGERIKEIHAFCARCGLNMIIKPTAGQKKYCDYPTQYKRRDGKTSIVNGCAGIRQRERTYARFKRIKENQSQVKKIVVKTEDAKPGKNLCQLMRGYFPSWPVADTPIF
jgi:hypothetical protein